MKGKIFFRLFCAVILLSVGLFIWKKYFKDSPSLIHAVGESNASKQGISKIVAESVAVDPKNSKFFDALSINFMQKFHNVDRFGEHSNDAAVIVVQLEQNYLLFKEFLSSLKQVRGIDKATVVISMNRFSGELDQLINGIDFCRYVKIVFPFSMHFFNHSFPGEDKKDCPRDMPKSQALLTRCNNADYPDTYGHYREIEFVQMKHHWLWQLFMVFEGIKAFSKQEGPVIFLEENHFILPDLLHCAGKALELKQSSCPNCAFINLGNYEPAQNYNSDNAMEISPWTGAKANMGLIISKEMFEIISNVADSYCEFDDYNWAWSLQSSLVTKDAGKRLTLQLKSSRVYHLGTCIGLRKDCQINDEINNIKSKFKEKSLFPDRLSITSNAEVPSQIPRPNGGWGDIRDHILCKNFKRISKSDKL